MDAKASTRAIADYRMSWITANALLHRGNSWSGNERHCTYLNPGSRSMINISSTAGLDFAEDGRGLAVTDWDRDGDWDLWITNRTAPMVRVMRNEAGHQRAFLALRLQGTTCNHDAIGARVTLTDRLPVSTQTVRAGDAFISQSSKWIHFGLGDDEEIPGLVIRWPDGKEERIAGLRANRHYHIIQGSGRAEVVGGSTESRLAPAAFIPTASPSASRMVAYSRLPLPQASLRRPSAAKR